MSATANEAAGYLPRPYPRAVSRPAVATLRTWPWERVGLLAILLLSAVLEFWRLNDLGATNAYYAAAVLSMTQNLHAFFFNSLDSVGFVTIDKPPLGFWIQAISARLMGFSGFSILLPEALATVGSVALVYHLVKRAFGGIAGLLAAMMLALVPISVVVGRNNTIDPKRIGHLALGGAVMLAVSLAWPLAVDLTPANLRPWMDSTQDNSAISLALGYNGIQRLLGMNTSLAQFLNGLGLKFAASDATTTTGGFGVGGMFNNGPAGVFRLFDQQLGGQASWILPLSLVGALLTTRLPIVGNRRRQTALVFGAWLLAAGAFFSVAGFFHSYYLVMLGPPVAALAAIGIVAAWQSRNWLILPTALAATAVVQAYMLSSYSTWSTWLTPTVLIVTGIGCMVLVLARFRKSAIAMRTATGIAVTGLLIAPLVWSGYSILHGSGGLIPSAGPQLADTAFAFGGGAGAPARPDRADMPQFGMPGGEVSADVVSYLEANQGSATYLVATPNSQSAASIILAANEPVMSLGGFSGSDPILTTDEFADLVKAGQVRYVLAGGGFGGPQRSGSDSVMSWVQANGTPVTVGNTQLYDLSALQGGS